MVKAKDLPLQFSVFKDIWILYLKYYDIGNADREWEQFLNELSQVGKEKYNNNQLYIDLAIVIANDISRKT